MISSFRHYLETWYVRAFFLLMVASFVLWGVGDMLKVIGTSNWIARVGDTAIDPQTMDAEYRRALQTASRDLPSGQELPPAARRQVGEQVLQRLIGQTAMTQTLRDMKIVVPDQALVEATRAHPAFKGADGKFDKARLDRVVRGNGMTEAGFLDLMRGDIARQELMSAVTAGARAPDSEAMPIYAMEFEKRSADMAAFPINAVPEPAVPDAAAARRWYDNHPDLYVIPEYRAVKLIVLSPQTVGGDVEISDKDLQAAYERHLADYTTVAKRAAEVISIGDGGKAEALAKTWRAGADWAAMQAAAAAAGGAAISQADATATEYPDPDLAKAVFAASGTSVLPPVKGALGWFVIRVSNIVEGGVEPFEAVKFKLRARIATEKALDQVYDRANKIDGLLANGANLETLPGDLNVAATSLTFERHGVTPDGSSAAISGETEIRNAVLAAAFEAPKGDAPHLIEVATPSTGGSGYFALTVEDITPSGPKPFETVRAAIDDDWRADQRRHAADQAAAGMLAAVKGGKAFSDAARDAGVTPVLSAQVTRSGGGDALPREAHQVLFTLKAHEPSMVETAEGFLVLTPVEIIAPDPKADPAGYQRLRQALSRTIGADMGRMFEEAVRLRANPKINQANLDRFVQP